MTARSSRPDAPAPRPLSNWVIAAGALVVLAVVAVIWWVLLRRFGGQGASVQLDAIRTGGTLVIGTGGAVALLLTARRQRYIELSLVQTDRDATERRVTELYTKAADQLGSEQAPVRLAGLYALERLAHSAVEHRQSIVDVICAYLRMPYTPPQPWASMLGRPYPNPRPVRRRRARTLTDGPAHGTPTSQESRREHAEQELQVRLAAQDILVRNLRVTAQRRQRWWQRSPPPVAPTWPGIRLDLTGAHLHKFSLVGCQLDYADFTRAQFTHLATFGRAQFTGGADFVAARFTYLTSFGDTQFTRWAYFDHAQFADKTYFGGAQFAGTSSFSDAQFTGKTSFRGAQFAGWVRFEGAQFTGEADFEGVRVASAAASRSEWPPGWTTRSAKPEDGENPAFLYLTEAEEIPDA